MNYCSDCGATLAKKIPEGEHVLRDVCTSCHMVHYENPKIVAGCIPKWEDQILLCRRAIEPRVGLWTFPAGFMELGESTEEAAIRETLEEAKAKIRIESLYALFSLPRVGQVYVVYRGILLNQDYGPGDESLEVQLFPPTEIPWNDLAFPVIHEILRHYTEDVGKNAFPIHEGTISRQPFSSLPSPSLSPPLSSLPNLPE